MNEDTTKQETDLQERLMGFNEELKVLLGKYELGVAAMPKIMQNGTLSADPVIVSVRKQEVAIESDEVKEEEITLSE